MNIRMRKTDWNAGLRFLIRDGRHYVENLTFKPAKEGEYIGETGHLTPEEAQVLMDDLWNCGLRPTEGTGSAGSLKATQNHLSDLQRLVFRGKK